MNELLWAACIVFCGLLIAWYLYMWTFRTQDMAFIVKQHEEAKRAQLERMSRMAGGAVKAGLTIGKMLRK
jgi:hypothetical protein